MVGVCEAVPRMSHAVDLTADLAQGAGAARKKLPASSEWAAVADTIVPVAAPRAGEPIANEDRALRDDPGVVGQ